MTGADLVTAVQNEGGIDASRTRVLGWVNQRHKEMVGRSRWLKAEVELGPTVAGQKDYALDAGYVDVVSLIVTGADAAVGPYSRTGEAAIFDLRSGLRELRGSGGVFAPFHDADGVEKIQLYPVPTVSGSTITALVAILPADLEDTGASVPVVPDDYGPAIRDAAIAVGLRLMDERLDLASAYEAAFEKKVDDLRKEGNARIGGQTFQAQLQGVHF